jgi:integrase/recombinase XerD
MGKLRQKMINDMIVRGFAERTQKSYVHAVVALVKHYHRSPDKLSDEQVQAYLAYLYRDRKLSWSSVNVAVHGLRFFYRTTLGRDRVELVVPAARRPSRLPEILSAEEVARIIEATETRKQRVLLMTTYAAGLRVSEVIALRVSDIDANRQTIRVEQGKGMRDRYTLLSQRLLEELRAYWRRVE